MNARLLLLALFLLTPAISTTAAEDVPPEGGIDTHWTWAQSSKMLETKIERLEILWRKYLPVIRGGTDPDIEEFEDAPHFNYVMSTSWALARAYVSKGDKVKALAMLDWIERYDSKFAEEMGLFDETE